MRVLADFRALKSDEVTVYKGDSVQILGLDQTKGYYFIRKLQSSNNSDYDSEGWLPPHVLQNPGNYNSSSNSKKPWSFRFMRKSNRRDKDLHRVICGSSEDVVEDLLDEFVPVFSHDLQPIKCMSGEQISLQCRLYMNPNEPLVVTWKDAFGHVIRSGPRHQITFNETSGISTLTIQEVRLSDSGTVYCIAANDVGTTSTSALISVTGKASAQIFSKYLSLYMLISDFLFHVVLNYLVVFSAVAPSRTSIPTIRSVDCESVEMDWSTVEDGAPTNRSSVVKFFTVQHSLVESEIWTSCAVVADCHCKVQHLSPGQMYSFRIIAHGEGSTRSEPSLPSEPIIIPPNSPQTPNTRTPSYSFNTADTGSMNGDSTNDTEFHKRYVELEDIDRGRFSVLRKCQEVSTGTELTVKFVHRKRWKKQLIVKEYEILSAISHPHVVRGLAFCETVSCSAVVMEL